MERRKVFLSYAHQDRDWRDRVLQHISPLQRWGLVDTWSDARISVGTEWERQIGAALDEARVAVLLVSPAFLSSTYIWDKEIGPLLTHAERGMLLLPLIVRPCAWRLAQGLSDLQAFPSDGRAISLGSAAEMDLDLSVFTYDLAALIGSFPPERADEERELADRSRNSALGTPATLAGPSAMPAQARIVRPELTVGDWTGEYEGNYGGNSAPYGMTLRIADVTGQRVRGSMEYSGSKTRTQIEGELLTGDDLTSEDLAELMDVPGYSRPVSITTLGMRFRETSVLA